MPRYPDTEVWQRVQKEQRFLITQDLDFSDLRLFIPGTHGEIILVRLHYPGRLVLMNRIRDLFKMENPESWRGCFVVVTDRKIRVRGGD